MPYDEVLANYLPQFHECAENNQWWGQGFTEWTLVRAAKPLYDGHSQPRVPNIGYYDLSDGSFLGTQYKLASNYGITGFNSYFYWSKGRTLLDQVIIKAFENPELEFRMCFTWANHPWTRTWSNREGAEEVLFPQEYEEDRSDFVRYCRHLAKYFSDRRYITVGDRPLFCIYKPEDLPNSYISKLREVFLQVAGVEPYLVGFFNKRATGSVFSKFDAIAPFNPTNALFEKGNQLARRRDLYSSVRSGVLASTKRAAKFGIHLKLVERNSIALHDYPTVNDRLYSNYIKTLKSSALPVLPMVFTGFDNTPRYGNRARIIGNTCSRAFEKSVEEVSRAQSAFNWDAKVLFVNAWNEWSEGMYLEPDQKDGYAFLIALREGLRKASVEVGNEAEVS